jgi:hypothetical protein
MVDKVVAAELVPDNGRIDQFVVDYESAAAREGCEMSELPGPADEGLLQALNEKLEGFIPELLGCLLRWRDGGVAIGDYTLLGVGEILTEMEAVAPPELPIGRDLDGALLAIDTGSGMLSTLEDGALTAMNTSLGSFCGLFIFELVGRQYEWADGWVRKG